MAGGSPPRRIILTGFSGTGKTTVARALARRLGWHWVDTDDLVVAHDGRYIHQIFQESGEEYFRGLERMALRQATSPEGWVVATGGGAVLRPENRRLLAERGLVVCLEASPETIHQRLRAEQDRNPAVRPLLQAEDPLARIRELKAFRQPYYRLCDWTVDTDGRTADEVAAEVQRVWETQAAALWSRRGRPAWFESEPAASEQESPYADHGEPAAVVRTPAAEYPVYVGWGILESLGHRLKAAGLAGAAWVVSDASVAARYGGRVRAVLERAGFQTDLYAVPPGDASKSLETAAALFDWLAARRAERRDAVVALGGGMVTDLGGFVAATYLRGLPLVHVPTSLLGMVDAAIGGKVAVNHREAKNLIGAFYQPWLVLCDVALLATLSPRELTSGWAEAIKHALILDPDLLDLLEREAEAVARLDRDLATRVIARSAALKAAVVSEDEREAGRRTILNYGHTVGHALEAATGYEALLHGEAVAVGMAAVGEIGVRLGVTPPALRERQDALLRRFGLPLRAPGVDPERVLAAMALDKKVSGKAIRWVLLEEAGRPVIRDDVPPELAADVVRLVTAAG
ncbi:MAG TPA: 3-dehydroquinate synthase [Dehalococcoidia bacterium]